MRRILVIACLAALAGSGLRSPAAVAHGPCRCLTPVVVQAGSQVRITEAPAQPEGVGWPAYRVMFNPRPTDFGIAPGYLASAYRADAPTTTVLSRPRRQPTRNGRFRVPKGTPPGLYMVLVWDGDEGGGHNSWEYLHVTDWDEPDGPGVVAQQEEAPEQDSANSPTPTEEAGGTNSSTPWPLVAGIGLGGVIFGAAASRAAARRRP